MRRFLNSGFAGYTLWAVAAAVVLFVLFCASATQDKTPSWNPASEPA